MKTHLTYLSVVMILCILLLHTIQSQRNQIKQQESIIAEKEAQIKYHVNDKGRIVAEKIAAEASVKELAEAYPKLKKELSSEFNVKMKNMKAYIRNEFEARGSGISTITNNYYDTSTQKNVQRLEFNDGYLKFSASIDSTSVAQSEYQYNDTITTVIHSKKVWFLGNERLYSSSKLNNPSVKVTSTTNLLVKHRDKRWVVSAGVYGDPIRKAYGIGFNLGYALFKF